MQVSEISEKVKLKALQELMWVWHSWQTCLIFKVFSLCDFCRWIPRLLWRVCQNLLKRQKSFWKRVKFVWRCLKIGMKWNKWLLWKTYFHACAITSMDRSTHFSSPCCNEILFLLCQVWLLDWSVCSLLSECFIVRLFVLCKQNSRCLLTQLQNTHQLRFTFRSGSEVLTLESAVYIAMTRGSCPVSNHCSNLVI